MAHIEPAFLNFEIIFFVKLANWRAFFNTSSQTIKSTNLNPSTKTKHHNSPPLDPGPHPEASQREEICPSFPTRAASPCTPAKQQGKTVSGI